MIHYPSNSNDLQNLPYPSNCDIQIFTGGSGVLGLARNWRIWNKPKYSTMTYMLLIGAGAGGGGGFSAAGNNDKGGGGGGASGGISRLLIPSFFLPEILYIWPGEAGQGGAAATAGGFGFQSYVVFSPETFGIINVQNILASSSTDDAGVGGAGTATTATGGSAPTLFAGSVFTEIGIFLGSGGQAGAAAPSGAGNNPGNSITAWGTIPISSGASGGSTTGTDTAGGAITATAATNFTDLNFTNTAGGVASAGAAGSGNGSSGVNIWAPFRSSGGAGGGTSQAGVGGSGGNGGIGSGGGGGGSGQTGGRGGNGGPGMVMIMSW